MKKKNRSVNKDMSLLRVRHGTPVLLEKVAYLYIL